MATLGRFPSQGPHAARSARQPFPDRLADLAHGHGHHPMALAQPAVVGQQLLEHPGRADEAEVTGLRAAARRAS